MLSGAVGGGPEMPMIMVTPVEPQRPTTPFTPSGFPGDYHTDADIPQVVIAGADEDGSSSRPESVRSVYPPFGPAQLAAIRSQRQGEPAVFDPDPADSSHASRGDPSGQRSESGGLASDESDTDPAPVPGARGHGLGQPVDRPRIVLPPNIGAAGTALSPESAYPVTAETGSVRTAYTDYGNLIPSTLAEGLHPYSPGESTRAGYFTDGPTGADRRSDSNPEDLAEPRVPHSPQTTASRRRRHALTTTSRPELGKLPSLHSVFGPGGSPGHWPTQTGAEEPSGGSEGSSNARSFVPGHFGAGEGADAGLGQQPYAYTSQGGGEALNPKASARTSLDLRFKPSKLGMSSVRTGPTTPMAEKPLSPEMQSAVPLPDVREEPGRSPTPPGPLSEDEINQRLKQFDGIYPEQTPKVRERTEQLFRELLQEFPELSFERQSPQVAAPDAAAPDAAQQAAPAQPLADFVARNVRIRVNPAFTTGEGIVPLYLADRQAKLRRWEGAHQPNFELIRQAFEIVEEVNQLKKNGAITTAKKEAAYQSKENRTITMAQKQAAYERAAALLRRGIGIDDDTWELAKADIRKMGAWDASDGLLHLLVTAGFAGLIGADLFPEGVKKFAKYPLTLVSNTVLNAFSQIGLNAIQDVASGNHGVPVMAANIAASPRLMDLSPTIMTTIQEVRDTMQQLQGDPDNLEELRGRLRTLDKRLEKHHTDYKLKIASARTYMEKYRRTLPYRIVVSMPTTIATLALAPEAPFMLPVAVGLAALHQAVIIGLARWDEVSKFNHVLLSNAVRGNYIKRNEDGTPQLDENNRPVVDTDVIRAMWSHPVDKIQNEFALVYTERLARYYRQLNKDCKALKKAGSNAANRQK